LEKTKNCAELLRRLKENCIGHKMALQNSSATFDPRKTSQLLDEPSEQYKDFGLIPAEITQQQQRLLCMSFHCNRELLGA
jgi:hypothetical protein